MIMSKNSKFDRSCGVLLHVSSLPSRHGIGDMGIEAYKFVDFLKASDQKYWQILPMTEVGKENAPYNSCSAFAGNPLLISLDKLVEDNLLSKEEVTKISFPSGDVDYKKVKLLKGELLTKAYNNFKNTVDAKTDEEFEKFVMENDFWLHDYALFKVASVKFGTLVWVEWDSSIANRDSKSIVEFERAYADAIKEIKFIQYIFIKQWRELKLYANNQDIKIIGDIPIYVSYESAEVWAHKELFDLDEKGIQKNVSGVAPDYFAKDGQVWGNPLYNWEEHRKTNYSWWLLRVQHMLKFVDYLRIDHFIGFETYYAIPFESLNSREGVYIKGPAYEIMNVFLENLEDMPLIVEDLGDVSEAVEELRDYYVLPGMRILQFGFKSEDVPGYLPNFKPHNYIPNTIVYTGTHDNMTVKQWFESDETDERSKQNFKRYINKDHIPNEELDVCWEMIRIAYASVGSIAIVPLQDILNLGAEARMNVPGVAKGNWCWRYKEEDLTIEIVNKLKELVNIYDR